MLNQQTFFKKINREVRTMKIMIFCMLFLAAMNGAAFCLTGSLAEEVYLVEEIKAFDSRADFNEAKAMEVGQIVDEAIANHALSKPIERKEAMKSLPVAKKKVDSDNKVASKVAPATSKLILPPAKQKNHPDSKVAPSVSSTAGKTDLQTKTPLGAIPAVPNEPINFFDSAYLPVMQPARGVTEKGIYETAAKELLKRKINKIIHAAILILLMACVVWLGLRAHYGQKKTVKAPRSAESNKAINKKFIVFFMDDEELLFGALNEAGTFKGRYDSLIKWIIKNFGQSFEKKLIFELPDDFTEMAKRAGLNVKKIAPFEESEQKMLIEHVRAHL